jgi:hypothetical protein
MPCLRLPKLSARTITIFGLQAYRALKATHVVSHTSTQLRYFAQWKSIIRHFSDPRSVPPLAGMLADAPVRLDFKYTRLNWASNEIRLIEILPEDKGLCGKSDEHPVSCTIRNVSLDDHPDYIGLSYAWGDTTRRRTLLLNGKQMSITASLDDALRQLRSMRSQGHTFGSRPIWVDAICINQEDELEKSWQVQQMGRIFHDADYTVVWLGPASESSQLAMETLERIGHGRSAGHEPVDNPTMDLFRQLALAPEGFSAALNALLLRSWWKRIWVVQEFAVAKDVVFLCGDVSLWWKFCYKGLDAVEKYKITLAEKGMRGNIGGKEYRKFMAETSTISGILRLFRIRSAFGKKRKRNFSLWELLTLKRFGMQASDSRDIVYALTGIADDAARKHVYPDYSKHTKDVYTQIAQTFLAEEKGRLRTLWLCSQPRQLPNLPSWVPDWSTLWKNDRRHLSQDGGYGTSGPIFAASRQARPVVSFSTHNERQILHLQGYAFDTVQFIRPAFDITEILKCGGLFSVHLAVTGRGRALWDLYRSHPNNSKADIHAADTIIRTTIADLELVWGPDITSTYRRASPDLLQKLHETFITPPARRIFQTLHNLSAAKLDILYRHNGRRPFITEKGRLGLGPSMMQAGDIVAVILGAEVPFILRRRKEDGRYEVIGEAYVDGIMDGEVMDMALEKDSFDLV